MTTKSKKPTTRRSPRQKAADARARAAKPKAAPSPEPTATPGTAADTGTMPKTIGDLAEAYLKALEAAGKSRGTVFGYSIDLALATRHFGESTKLTAITEQKVTAFFESDTVTKTRRGRPKAKPTIDKTRRVLRMALDWAADQQLIDAAPIPEKYAARKKTATA